jgi:adenosylcobinamide-GDP ribazoletransferase
MNLVKRFLIALQFLTIIPVNIKGKISEEDFGRSLVYFPIVGLLLGLFLALIAFIAGPLPPLVRGSLILIAWIIITGGIHLDGFADTCDGFYGKRSREDILKIMRDSRIGAMGAIGLMALLLLKFAILSSVAQEDLWKVLVITAVFARWSQVLACTISKYARDEGKAKYFVEHAKYGACAAGALFTLILFWLVMSVKGVILFALLSAAMFLFIKCIQRRIGGMTGDTIGATSEVAEMATLLLSLILLSCKV